VVRVYNLREVTALFLEEENLVYAQYFRKNYFVPKLAYLSDHFEKFSALNMRLKYAREHTVVL
jgi:hypothetical protein